MNPEDRELLNDIIESYRRDADHAVSVEFNPFEALASLEFEDGRSYKLLLIPQTRSTAETDRETVDGM